VLAYLLDPLADRLERAGLGRLGSTLIILVLASLALVLAIVVIAPFLASQIAALVAAIPDYLKRLQALAIEQGEPLLRRFGGENVLKDIQSSLGDFIGQGASVFGTFVASLVSGGQALLGIVSLLVVTPVVAFYLLLDWDDMVARIDRLVPRRQRPVVRKLAREIDVAIAGFIRGQALVCIILGLWYAIGLWLIGLNFGLLIGLIAGFISFIPYVGSLSGLLLAVGVAIVQFWPDWVSIMLVVAVFVTGQFLEGNILSPKLVGQSVGLHPVWLMFALFAFGSLFGFVGLLVAVPLAAIIGVLLRFAVGEYERSSLHRGVRLKPGGGEEPADG
jgi:predicted PurR-regulated permease PerM